MEVGAFAAQRVSLRAIREDDAAAIEAWFDEAVAAAGIPHPLPLSRDAGEGRSVGARKSGALAIERVGESGPVGCLEYQVAGGWLTVAFIALAKPYRGRGYGSEAVRLLEEWAIRRGLAERSRADVDVRNGLGLYFWLRLGYRPAGRDDFEWRGDKRADSMAMIRISGEACM